MGILVGLRALTLAGMAGMSGMMAKCEGGGTFRGAIPGLGEGEVHWNISPDKEELPPAYRPTRRTTVTITDDKGRKFVISLCIAENPDDPSCIYVNSGGCDAEDSWQRACSSSVSHQLGAPGSGGSPTPASETPMGSLCPDEGATISYDSVTGVMSIEFTTVDCGSEAELLPEDLVDVYLTPPGAEIALPWETFGMMYGGIIPSGTRVLVSGDAATVAWNAYQLRRIDGSFVMDNGSEVVTKLVEPGLGLPPLAVTVIDGEIVRSEFVTDPR